MSDSNKVSDLGDADQAPRIIFSKQEQHIIEVLIYSWVEWLAMTLGYKFTRVDIKQYYNQGKIVKVPRKPPEFSHIDWHIRLYNTEPTKLLGEHGLFSEVGFMSNDLFNQLEDNKIYSFNDLDITLDRFEHLWTFVETEHLRTCLGGQE